MFHSFNFLEKNLSNKWKVFYSLDRKMFYSLDTRVKYTRANDRFSSQHYQEEFYIVITLARKPSLVGCNTRTSEKPGSTS